MHDSPALATPGQIIRGRGVMDGATTLVEAGLRLELMGRYLQRLAQQGWTLHEPVEDDFAVVLNAAGHILCLECHEVEIEPDRQTCGACSMLVNEDPFDWGADPVTLKQAVDELAEDLSPLLVDQLERQVESGLLQRGTPTVPVELDEDPGYLVLLGFLHVHVAGQCRKDRFGNGACGAAQ